MTHLLASPDLPPWAIALGLAAHLGAGIGLGVLYFQGLWWSARLFAGGDRIATAVALSLGRFVVLGGVLALASFEGALPLLATALGVLLGRAATMRRVREGAP